MSGNSVFESLTGLAVAFLFLLLCVCAQGASPRVVSLSESDVFEVKNAVGYSTILQFDAKPTSVVLGDQDSFKVEYVGNSLTIKPSRIGASTNLFVFTDYERFSFRLTSGKGNADYLLHVRKKGVAVALPTTSAKAAISSDLDVKKVGASARENGVTLQVNSISYPPSRKAVIVHFSIQTENDETLRVSDFSLEQEGKPVPFHELHLTGEGHGIFVVRSAKLNHSHPAVLHYNKMFLHVEFSLNAKNAGR
jgi:hypothetical protein